MSVTGEMKIVEGSSLEDFSCALHHIVNDTGGDACSDDPVYEMCEPTYQFCDAFGFEATSVASRGNCLVGASNACSVERYNVSVNRPVRIYCDGIYDLFHYGHARALRQAKSLFKNATLIVGVPSDKMTVKLKGPVVLSEKERVESLRHCRYVDEIIENAPWVITDAFLEKYRIDLVAHDDAPYVAKGYSDDIYADLKKTGKFVPIRRTSGISTTSIITSIVKNFDRFVWRNLARGISSKELNLSLMKKIELELKGIELHMRSETMNMRREIVFAFDYWVKRKWIRELIMRVRKIRRGA